MCQWFWHGLIHELHVNWLYSHNKLWLRFCTSVCTWSSQPNQIAKNANQVFVLWSLEWTSWFYCWPDSWEESKRQVPCAVLRFVCVFVFYSIIFIFFGSFVHFVSSLLICLQFCICISLNASFRSIIANRFSWM